MHRYDSNMKYYRQNIKNRFQYEQSVNYYDGIKARLYFIINRKNNNRHSLNA